MVLKRLFCFLCFSCPGVTARQVLGKSVNVLEKACNLVLQLLPVRSERLRKSHNLDEEIKVENLEQRPQEDGEQTVVSDSNTANRLHQYSGNRLRR